MESQSLSLILSAILVLARAENGALLLKRGRTASEPELKAPTRQLQAGLQSELARWGYSELAGSALELLRRAELLVKEGDRLVPTPAVFSWLQLPPALMLRYLTERSGVLPDEALLKALKRGIKPSELKIPMGDLKLLVALGLAQEKAGLFYVRGQANRRLLELTLAMPTETPLDDPALLELDKAWKELFPGQWLDSGWLRWHEHAAHFSFVRPVSSAQPTFRPWTLFRLLSLCELKGSGTEKLFCVPDLKLVGRASNTGLGFEGVMLYLTGGLDRLAPSLAQQVKKWYRTGQRYRMLKVTLLEAATPEDMQTLLADRRIRSYIPRLISHRYGLVPAPDMGRLSELMERRGIFLNVPLELDEEKSSRSSGLPVKLGRKQVQELLAALVYYRRSLVESGSEVMHLESLLESLRSCLSLAENREALRLAELVEGEVVGESGALSEIADLAETKAAVAEAIRQEATLLVEYVTPGKGKRQRRLDPLLLEEREGLVYLTAYCHLRQEERVFRLDRLRVLVSEK